MKLILLYATSVVICIVLYSCEYDNLIGESGRTIRLRYAKAYDTETRERVTTGIAWNLSFLGALLPKGSLASAITWESESSLLLNLDKLGLTTQALAAFDQLLVVMKESSEYQNTGGIDIGRFFSLTLTSSNHYYAITGVRKSLDAFKAAYLFDAKKAGIITSSVALGHRVIEINTPAEATNIAFLAQEGSGSIIDNTFNPIGFEALDIMPNGQLRFAIYDSDGNLKAAANPTTTLAGKPAKCLWCHEISLLPLFAPTQPVTGYYSPEEFELIVSNRTQLLREYRSSLSSDIDFTKTQDHTLGELLYVSFMEPNAERLASEWRLPIEEVKIRLASLSTHENHEFPFLGNDLFFRKDVDSFAPFEVIEVPEDARELSPYEPNFIHF